MCTDLLTPTACIADVGCDHGYLSIYLLEKGFAKSVIAMDLREKPLEKAKENAIIFHVEDKISFLLCDGVEKLEKGSVDCVVCAGMGGDTIAGIMARCSWAKSQEIDWILQAQTSGNDLRRWLGENEFTIVEEKLVEENGFLYGALKARYGGGKKPSPAQEYVSDALLASDSPLLGTYLEKLARSMKHTVMGISQSQEGSHTEKLKYYATALRAIEEMRRIYDNG